MRRLTAVLPLLLLACSTEFMGPSPAAIELSVTAVTLGPEELRPVEAIAFDDEGRVIPPSAFGWRSTDRSVVTVDANGMLTGVAEGDAAVIASVGGVADTLTVRVRRDWSWIGHSCRVRGDGVASCGGIPLDLPGPVTAAYSRVSGPQSTQCAISGGALLCRGSDYQGMRGDGGGADYATTTSFAAVAGGGTWTEVTGGSPWSFCGVRNGGTVCWGSNAFGITGSGTTAGILDAPTPVAGGVAITGLQQPSYGQYCGIAQGRIWCWGYQIDSVPKATTPDLGLVRASVAEGGFCGLNASGVARCGALTDPAPPLVPTDLRFIEIFGVSPACGLTAEGEIWCWGDNTYGFLGRPGPGSATPVRIQSPQRFAHIMGSEHGLCAITTGGAEYCWGGFDPDPALPPAAYLPRRTPSPY